MKTVKKYSRRFPLREYLYRRVSKTGPEPEQLPSERKLAEDFGVARETVRMVIAELEENGYCMRIPGKKALFTNPEHCNPDIVFVGVLAHGCKGAELSHYAQGILSRIHLKIEHLTPFYQIIALPEHFTPEEKADYIFKQQHDALLWLLPEEKGAETFTHLWSNGAPLTVVGPGMKLAEQCSKEFSSGLICPEAGLDFQNFAQICKKKEHKKPFFFLFHKFQEEILIDSFRKAGLATPDFCILHDKERIESDIHHIFSKKDYDVLFITHGDAGGCEPLLDGIGRNKDIASKQIIMPYGYNKKSIQLKYDLNISFLDRKVWSAVLEDLSTRAAERVNEFLENVDSLRFS